MSNDYTSEDMGNGFHRETSRVFKTRKGATEAQGKMSREWNVPVFIGETTGSDGYPEYHLSVRGRLITP